MTNRGTTGSLVLSALLLWMAAVMVASATGWLARLPAQAPPPFALLTLLTAMAVYASVPSLRRYVATVGLRRLTAIHILRMAAAPLFFWYGAHHLLPQVFVVRAGWGDVAAGVAALLAVLWNRRAGYWFAHVLGMADFIDAFATAIALTRHDAGAMHAITGLPAALIPFWGVGFLATTHIIAFHLLLSSRREPGRPGTPVPLPAGQVRAKGAL